MRDEDIHIGDVLRVRQWEDMAAEYGTTDDENSYFCAIQVNKYVKFLKKRKYLCGQTFTVSECYDSEFDNETKFYCSKEGVEIKDLGRGDWLICAEMLEPIIEEDLEVANDEDIKLLFG